MRRVADLDNHTLNLRMIPLKGYNGTLHSICTCISVEDQRSPLIK